MRTFHFVAIRTTYYRSSFAAPANPYEATVRTSLQDWHAPVIDGTAAGLPDSLSQPRADYLARLELQRWRQDANHRNFKIGPCQIEHVNGDTASFQSLVNSLETNGRVVRYFAWSDARFTLWPQQPTGFCIEERGQPELATIVFVQSFIAGLATLRCHDVLTDLHLNELEYSSTRSSREA